MYFILVIDFETMFNNFSLSVDRRRFLYGALQGRPTELSTNSASAFQHFFCFFFLGGGSEKYWAFKGRFVSFGGVQGPYIIIANCHVIFAVQSLWVWGV